MTTTDYRIQLRDMQNRLCRDDRVDGETYCTASDWVRGQLAEMEREHEKDRPARRPSLRTRLKVLLSAILTQTPAGGKKVAQDA